jgi:hypothetical protein
LGWNVYFSTEETIGTGMYILISCFYSLSAVSLGWWVSLHVSKRQSTVNIIAQSRINQYYLERIKGFENVFPASEKLTIEKANENPDALSDLLIVINFLEFISIGIKHGDLSESVCKAFFIKIFSRQWFRCSDYIHHQQVHESDGLYKNFEHYSKKWNPSLK